jgi:hypothetical protein
LGLLPPRLYFLFFVCNIVVFAGIVSISSMSLLVSKMYSSSRQTFSVVPMLSSFRRFSDALFSSYPFVGNLSACAYPPLGTLYFPQVFLMHVLSKNVVYSSLTYRAFRLSNKLDVNITCEREHLRSCSTQNKIEEKKNANFGKYNEIC